MATKKTPKLAPEYEATRAFIDRYSVLDNDYLNVVAVWAMGTHCFSPMATWPATFPYMYICGPTGSGKTVLGQDSLGAVCREWVSASGATGPTLFRMLGTIDDETGRIENHAPTLCMDEIDATFSGQKDEPLRLSLNVGYKRGATIPRSSGKTSIAFPVYGPKILMGIENGHLPETVTNRSIRIEMKRQTRDQLVAAGKRDFEPWDIEDEAPELRESLATWARDNSIVLRDYRPTSPPGLTARQWEISRSLIQLAHAIGNEDQIVASLISIFSRSKRQDARVQLYSAVLELMESMPREHNDRVTSVQILAKLNETGIAVPGGSMKGLSSVLAEDGIGPDPIRMRDGHPGIPAPGKNVQRGYYRHKFDAMFMKHLFSDDDC